jgi:hypothetical protein
VIGGCWRSLMPRRPGATAGLEAFPKLIVRVRFPSSALCIPAFSELGREAVECLIGRGVPDEEIGLAVDCRSVAERVVAGILGHRSQLHAMTDQPLNTERLQRIVRRERSAVIWPPRVASSRLLTDVFDDL